jgi:hypothetical protein
VVSTTDIYGRILGFLGRIMKLFVRSNYIFRYIERRKQGHSFRARKETWDLFSLRTGYELL